MDRDEYLLDAAKLIVAEGTCTKKLIHRKLYIGLGRAGRIVDQLNEIGFIGDENPDETYDILISSDIEEFFRNLDNPKNKKRGCLGITILIPFLGALYYIINS